ncbi:Piso0_005168 [Millerozyma farinosa CBS 7064]|uniref:Piso0_005168 protein n=1 Tax=Pichia sorbitophila (strain ATCC MYA-4447 / BCRC 22081 / CBS 7064 / NBRC 10061 / NRRL Y-12695) TaxID=559304 RepID=G8Y1G2_PICSO|nr:Piso0_005168 [Millerozyma farinosa CBS 7064]
MWHPGDVCDRTARHAKGAREWTTERPKASAARPRALLASPKCLVPRQSRDLSRHHCDLTAPSCPVPFLKECERPTKKNVLFRSKGTQRHSQHLRFARSLSNASRPAFPFHHHVSPKWEYWQNIILRKPCTDSSPVSSA